MVKETIKEYVNLFNYGYITNHQYVSEIGDILLSQDDEKMKDHGMIISELLSELEFIVHDITLSFVVENKMPSQDLRKKYKSCMKEIDDIVNQYID